MFSFFKSKKPSPTQIPAEPIPGAAPVPPREDEFIFIERRDSSPKSTGDGSQSGTTTPGQSGLYPSIPGTPTKDRTKSPTASRQRSEEKVNHALSGVPFKVAPELSLDSINDQLTYIQVNDMLSYVARTVYAPQYDFSLERSVLNE